MRYHFKKPHIWISIYGETYTCNHPVYNRCTLFLIRAKGLAVIQQRYDSSSKTTNWSEIDPWIANAIYTNLKFKAYFDGRSGVVENKLYPTVTVRQIMWALRMKPIKRERWETVFDRPYI